LALSIRFTATPTNLIESEQTVVTFRFELSEPPPAGGVTVTVKGNRPQSLNNLDLFNISVTGGDFPVGDFDFTGFDLTIRATVATITVPTFDNPEGIDPLYDGLRAVTYTLQPGIGYVPDPSARSVLINYVDNPSQIPITPNPIPITPNPSAPIVGTVNADRLMGTAADDRILGLGGNDTLLGRAGNDILLGGAGDDTLNGGNGNDRLSGGRGNDLLVGGKGDDILIGGLGRDQFLLERGPGQATIRDFQDRQDRLRLGRGLSFDSLTIRQSGRNTVISRGADVLAVLTGIRSNLITAADFS
jgi:hypothetical protein